MKNLCTKLLFISSLLFAPPEKLELSLECPTVDGVEDHGYFISGGYVFNPPYPETITISGKIQYREGLTAMNKHLRLLQRDGFNLLEIVTYASGSCNAGSNFSKLHHYREKFSDVVLSRKFMGQEPEEVEPLRTGDVQAYLNTIGLGEFFTEWDESKSSKELRIKLKEVQQKSLEIPLKEGVVITHNSLIEKCIGPLKKMVNEREDINDEEALSPSSRVLTDSDLAERKRKLEEDLNLYRSSFETMADTFIKEGKAEVTLDLVCKPDRLDIKDGERFSRVSIAVDPGGKFGKFFTEEQTAFPAAPVAGTPRLGSSRWSHDSD